MESHRNRAAPIDAWAGGRASVRRSGARLGDELPIEDLPDEAVGDGPEVLVRRASLGRFAHCPVERSPHSPGEPTGRHATAHR